MGIFEMLSGLFMLISYKCEEIGDKASFFNEYKSAPCSYFDVSSIDGAHTIKTEIFHGHVVRDTNGRKVVVTEMSVNGDVHYIERSIFNTGTCDITDRVQDIIYSGSIENCWYKWYLYQHQKNQ